MTEIHTMGFRFFVADTEIICNFDAVLFKLLSRFVKKFIYSVFAAAALALAGCEDPVSAPTAEVILNRRALTMLVGDSETLAARIKPEQKAREAIKWWSNEQSVAIVDDSGKITALSEGSAVIVAEAAGTVGTCVVTVARIVESGSAGPLVWELTDSGILIISGKGAMPDYDYYDNNSPWRPHRSAINSAIIRNGVTAIGNYAFEYCEYLTDITIPNSVASIGDGAFVNCSSLTGIIIPDSVTSIGGYAFYCCYSLTDAVIGTGVTSIEYATFAYCRDLVNINIPAGVISIGREAFYGCDELKSIVIPAGVTTIEYDAFGYCYNLKSVTVKSTTPPALGWNNFEIGDDVLYVPKGYLARYQSDEVWNAAFADIVEQR